MSKGHEFEGFPGGPVLALDTSTSAMTVAVVDGERVLGETVSEAERNHSVLLLPVVDELMRGLGLGPRDLRGVVIGCGPGSYTGVRIGVTVAKTFAWSLGLPVYGVSSLEALSVGGWRDAAALSPTVRAPAWVVPAIGARRGQAYTALFEAAADGGWRRLCADAIEPFREFAERVISMPGRPGTVVFVGETDEFADMLDAAAAGADAVVLRRSWTVAARDAAAVARRHGAAVRVADAHDLLPNYTQLAEAEAKLLARS